jgi:hypothetical protein
MVPKKKKVTGADVVPSGIDLDAAAGCLNVGVRGSFAPRILFCFRD